MSFQITKLIIKVKKDKNVKTMKIGLKALGYPIDNETNIFDEQLESAIKTFQQDNNLKVNGNFDKKTNDKFTEKLVEKANKKRYCFKRFTKQTKINLRVNR